MRSAKERAEAAAGVETIRITPTANFGFSALGGQRRVASLSWRTRNVRAGLVLSTRVKPRPRNESHMNPQASHDELRQEYDFSGGVRGKHYEAYRAGSNVVFLDPDIAEV